MRAIYKLYHQAEERHTQGIHVISVDEKTGIQALERIHPTQPAKPGQVERVEFEYQRHGTQALIANFEVATGKVVFPTIRDTRTEADFLAHIQQRPQEPRFCRMKATEFVLFIPRSIAHGLIRLLLVWYFVAPFAQTRAV